MQLTNPERLILSLLTDIAETVKIKTSSGIDPKFVSKAIDTDNTWALAWEYPSLFSPNPDPTPPTVSEVVDLLDMWNIVEEGVEKLTAPEKTDLLTTTGVPEVHLQFNGFDGNKEIEHISVAEFMIHDLGRFPRYASRDLNSHTESLSRYRNMYRTFEPIRATLSNRPLSLSELKIIVQQS